RASLPPSAGGSGYVPPRPTPGASPVIVPHPAPPRPAVQAKPKMPRRPPPRVLVPPPHVQPHLQPQHLQPQHPLPQRPPMPLPVYHPPSQVTLTLSTLTGTVEATRAEVDNGVRSVNLYDNQIHKLFAIAVACTIFVFLGAPIALRFPRGGVGMVLGVSLVAFAIYYIGLIAGEPLAQRGNVPPWLAMWASNIVFGIIGLFLLTRLGRESSTSRGGDWGEFKDGVRRRIGNLLRRRNAASLSTESA